MGVGSGLLFAMTVATALLPIGIVWVLIRYLHSRSRNELWVLRDSLVDDLLAGRLERGPGADRLLRVVETRIRIAGRHTLGDLFVALAALKDEDLPPIHDEIFLEGAPAPDRPVLERYLRRLWEISFRYLISSSPIGWALYLAIWVRSSVARFTSRPRSTVGLGRTSWAQLSRDLDHQPTVRRAKQVELGRIAELMPSREYRRERRVGPILEDMLSGPG